MEEKLDKSPTKATRLSTYREAWWGPIMWAVDGVLLLLAYGDLASKIAPSTEEWLKKLAFLSSLPWYLKIIIILCANIPLIGEGAFRAIRKREKQRDNLISELNGIWNAKPKIKLDDPDAIHVIDVDQAYADGFSCTSPFLRVRFINDPIGPFPSARAIDVRAKIEYYEASSEKPFLSIDGKWAESDQGPARDVSLSLVPLLKTTFGFKETRNLDIAYRDGRTKLYSAWNNEHYRSSCVHHVLKGNDLRVEISLMGEWVHEHFSFTFQTTSAGFVLPVSIKQPS